MDEMVESLSYLGKKIAIDVDRPMYSSHPVYDFIYPVNYGFVPGTISGDGEALDAYILGVDVPVKQYTGFCIAVIKRLDDNDDKLVVVPEEMRIGITEIIEAVQFQEQFFDFEVILYVDDLRV